MLLQFVNGASGVARNVNWGPPLPCPLLPFPSRYFNGGLGVIPPNFFLKLKVLVGVFRAFRASKFTPLWTRFFEQNFRISNRLYKYTCWASDRNAPFPFSLPKHARPDLAGGRLESPSVLTKKFCPAPWAPLSTPVGLTLESQLVIRWRSKYCLLCSKFLYFM